LGQPGKDAAVVGQPAPAGTGDLAAVSCADARHCWAVGRAATAIAATANGGLTWTAQHVDAGTAPDLSGISCPTKSDCMAVGSSGSVTSAGIVLTTRDGGASWDEATVPTGAFGISSVECAAVDDCTVILSGGLALLSAHSSDFGQTWHTEGELPGGFQSAGGLSCAGGTCLVPGYTPTTTGHGQGAVVVSTDDGHTWAAADVPAGQGLLQGTACRTVADCLAVGTTSTTTSDVVPARGEVLVSTDGGTTWAVSPAAPPADAYGVACPTLLVCAMVGTRWIGHPAVATGAVARSRDGGLTFAASSGAYVPLTLTALSCPTQLVCVAAGGNTLALITLPAPRHRAPHVRRS
jgi:photosystem II stability/assembly factor-like uncharacterized protein